MRAVMGQGKTPLLQIPHNVSYLLSFPPHTTVRPSLCCQASCRQMSSKWYAVRKGREIGVWDNWEHVSKLVSGSSGSEYMSFRSKEEAEAWLHEGRALAKAAVRFFAIRHPENAAGVYTDWGCVKPLVDGVKGASYKGGFGSAEEAASWIREAGVELMAPLLQPQSTAPPLQPSTLSSQAQHPSAVHLDASPAVDVAQHADSMHDLPPPRHTIQASEWYRLEFDGGSRGNPGPAGYGSVLRSSTTGELVQIVAGIIPFHTTNNQAEYAAVLAGLRAAQSLGVRHINVQGDSQLIVRQLIGRYKSSKEGGLAEYLKDAHELLKGFQKYDVKHVYRNENKDADLLGNLAMDVLRLVPTQPSAAHPNLDTPQIDGAIQQLLNTASQVERNLDPPSAGSPNGLAIQHVGPELRARVLKKLLQQWTSSAAVSSSARPQARLQSTNPVIIDLALPSTVASLPQLAREGSKGESRSCKGSSGGKRKRGKKTNGGADCEGSE